jgi:hypothetical protein
VCSSDLPLRACAGLLVGARIDEGTASGDFVFHTSTRRTGSFVFGPSLQLAWLPGTFHLALDAALLVAPAPTVFEVIDIAQFRQPVAQGLVRLSIGLGAAR